MHVELEHYTKVIRGVTVLDNISASFCSGRIYGLKGKNGSGKTMLLRAISGLIHPTSGTVTIDGQRLKPGAFPPSIGILIENPVFRGNLSAYKNLWEIAQIRGVVNEQDVLGAIAAVGLDPHEGKPVRTYSLGMRQRLGIACALMEHPQLILLDEPVNALDDAGTLRIRRLLLDERERGALIVIACHDSPEIEGIFDQTLRMAEGHFEPSLHHEQRASQTTDVIRREVYHGCS